MIFTNNGPEKFSPYYEQHMQTRDSKIDQAFRYLRILRHTHCFAHANQGTKECFLPALPKGVSHSQWTEAWFRYLTWVSEKFSGISG
jgi:hypothetical protein